MQRETIIIIIITITTTHLLIDCPFSCSIWITILHKFGLLALPIRQMRDKRGCANILHIASQ